MGLDDAQVAADYGSGRLRWDLARATATVLVTLPFAVLGIAVHAVPYGVVKLAGRVPANEGMRATVKVLGSFFLYSLTYVAIGVAVGRVGGAGLGVLAAVAAPACGYCSRSDDRTDPWHGWGHRRLPGHPQRRPGQPRSVRRRRAAVVDAARSVLDLLVGPRSLTNRDHPGTMDCTMFRTSTSDLLLT